MVEILSLDIVQLLVTSLLPNRLRLRTAKGIASAIIAAIFNQTVFAPSIEMSTGAEGDGEGEYGAEGEGDALGCDVEVEVEVGDGIGVGVVLGTGVSVGTEEPLDDTLGLGVDEELDEGLDEATAV
jgi:hypothetical protein